MSDLPEEVDHNLSVLLWIEYVQYIRRKYHLEDPKPPSEPSEGGYVRQSKRDYEPAMSLVFDDRELFFQVLEVALPRMTLRQWHSLSLYLMGLTQEQIAQELQIGQRSVSQHIDYAYRKVKEAAQEVLGAID